MMQRAVHSFQRQRAHLLPLSLMGAGLVLLSVLALGVGAVPITPLEVLQAIGCRLGLSSAPAGEMHQLILFDIRLPRLLFTLLIGSALGLSGAVLQGLFRNPLVEPGIIGVSSGAALGAVIVIIFLAGVAPAGIDFLQPYLMPVFAFLGGLAATVITLRLGRHGGQTRITYLILAGVAISSLAGAVIGFSIFFADDAQLRSYTFWTLGDLSVATWDKLRILLPLTALSLAGLLSLGGPLNALALGESEAFHSGVPVERVKQLAVFFSALAVGVCVSFTGMIGFVGLVVPHIIRMGLNPDHHLVLPGSALGGAALLVLADMGARTLVLPAELPIGVVTAIIGAPFFIYLLLVSKKRGML